MMKIVYWYLITAVFQLFGLCSCNLFIEKRLNISKLIETDGSNGGSNAAKDSITDSVYSERVLPAIMIADKLNQLMSHRYRYIFSAKDIQINHLDRLSGFFNVSLSTSHMHGNLTITGNFDFNTTMVMDINHIKEITKLINNNVIKYKFNNGSLGIEELTAMESSTRCNRDGDHSCTKGSVVVDPWVNDSLRYQRMLSYDVPLNFVQFLGTHNSFNNKADGYGDGDFLLGEILRIISAGKWDFVWAQQWFTITDQLNMGARSLMLDPVYFWEEMRLCHCGGLSVKWLNNVIKYIEKKINKTIDFDSHDLGCLPTDRTFSSAIQEIHDWLRLPQHSNEFIIVYINDETSDSDWGKIDLIQDPVATTFKDMMFTPSIKKKLYPDRWPSIRELISAGTNVMVTCTERCANDDIFVSMMIPQWDRDTVKYFKPFPECSGYQPGDWYLVGGESQVVGPIYNGPEEEGLVIKENFQDLLACPLSVIQLDLVSPELMSMGVWSWKMGYSVNNITNSSCPAMDSQGRWATMACNTSLHHLCVSPQDRYSFNISTTFNTWTHPQCPHGMIFGLPCDGYQNRLALVSVVTKYQLPFIWINATKM